MRKANNSAEPNASGNTIDASIQQLWVLQRGGGFRVWLGEKPQDVARNLAYFQTLIEAQQQAIAEYELGLGTIADNRSRIARRDRSSGTGGGDKAQKRCSQTSVQSDKRHSPINKQVQDDQQRLRRWSVIRCSNSLLAELETVAAATHPKRKCPLPTLRARWPCQWRAR